MLTNYEHTTYESIVESQCANLAKYHPQALGLLMVLSSLNQCGILLPILINGACLSQSRPERNTTLKQVHLTTLTNLRPHSSEPLHPINVLLDMLCSRTELHKLIRHLEHFSLVRIEDVKLTTHPTDCDPIYMLCISELARQTVQAKMGQSDEGSAYFGLAVEIMVTAFLQSESGDLGQEQYIQHISTLTLSDLDHGVISPHRRTALSYATEKLVEMDRLANLQNCPSRDPLYRYYGGAGRANTDIRDLMQRLAISSSFNKPKPSPYTDNAPADLALTSLFLNIVTGSAVHAYTNKFRATNHRLVKLMDGLLPLASPNLAELVAPCIYKQLKGQLFRRRKPKIYSLGVEKQRRAASWRFKNGASLVAAFPEKRPDSFLAGRYQGSSRSYERAAARGSRVPRDPLIVAHVFARRNAKASSKVEDVQSFPLNSAP